MRQKHFVILACVGVCCTCALGNPRAQGVPWVDQPVTPVGQMRPGLEAAAVELVKNPHLEEELNHHLAETAPGLNRYVSTLRKLQEEYAQLADHRPGLPQAWANSAAEFFGKLKSDAVLMEALKHPSMDVQGPAVRALGDLGYRPAVQPLVHLLRRYNFPDIGDEDYTIRTIFREQLIAALGKITRLDFVGVRPDDLRAVEEVAAKCESWAAEGGSDAAAVDSSLVRLQEGLRSRFLRANAERFYGDLRSPNALTIEAAVDFFYDLRAVDVLIDALDHGSFDVKSHTCRSLCDLLEKGDQRGVRALLYRLERTLDLTRGGLEDFISKMDFRKELMLSLQNLTGVSLDDLMPKYEVRGSIPLPVDSPSDVKTAIERVTEWLEDTAKPKAPIRGAEGTPTDQAAQPNAG